MKKQQIHRAICGSSGRPLKIGEIEIPCYVLEDGRRVLSGRGMQGALAICPEALAFLEQRDIETHVDDTPAAVERYNELAAAARVGGLFHSTC